MNGSTILSGGSIVQKEPGNYPTRGMTLLELLIVTSIFAVVITVAYGALASVRNFTRANVSQVELQEEARHALENVFEKLQNAGRFVQTSGPKSLEFPKIIVAEDGTGKPDRGIPKGYNLSNNHAPKKKSQAAAGTIVNGGDPTLESNEILFKTPTFGPDNLPVLDNGAVVWSTQEFGFFVVPDPLGFNRLEWRDSEISEAQLKAKMEVQGEILAKYIDRLQIDDYTSDPTLTTRQLKITLYLTRAVLREGVGEPIVLTVSISGVVDMRNSSQFQ
jgi:prepilin-type N-terminal cleavage/methylation domain-containing protein